MTRLAIVRHATADSGAACSDYDRQLTEQGSVEAVAAAGVLAGAVEAPLVIASSARRTTATARAIVEAIPGAELRTDGRLYQAGPRDWLETIQTEGIEGRDLVLVGHQPTMSQTAAWLAADAEGELGRFPPATIALLDTEATWAELGPEDAALLSVHRQRG